MHNKFIFSFVHRAYYAFFIIFALLFIVGFYVYLNLPTYQNRFSELFLNESIQSVDSQSDKLIHEMLPENKNFIALNILDQQVRLQNELTLQRIKYKNISSLFIVFFKDDKLYFLLDGSEHDKADLLQPFIPEEDIQIFVNMQSRQEKEIFIQDALEDIGFTLIKPIIQDDKVIAFMVVDYTQKSLEKILVFIHDSMQIVMLVSGFLMLILSMITLLMGVELYKKYKMYQIPNSKAYTRSFLTDYYERINFLHYYAALIDIDAFKRINDLYGEAKGNEVIHSVLHQISLFINRNDLLIQYGGEEFLLLIDKQCCNVEDFKTRMESIRSSVETLPIDCNQAVDNVTVSIGTLIRSENASSLQSAIYKADTALYCAKHNGRNRVCDFDLSEDKRTYREKLKEMIESDQLVCHYQPIVHLYNGTYHHFEALLRLKDGAEIIYPDKILPDLEDSYFYSRMSMKVIEYNVAKLRAEPKFIVSINLSADDLLNDAVIALLIDNADIADRMMVEILETKNIDYQSVESMIYKLKSHGYKICIDDFGTGFANFEHLFNLSIDYLKLDGSLIKNLHTDKRAHAIIRAIVDFCQQQKIEVIAEFVENQQIAEVLKKLGIVYGQGYYFDRAQPYEALIF